MQFSKHQLHANFKMQFENEKYDVIICGTSMYKSILSASLARVGQKVLHVDQNSYYGSHQTSFDLISYTEANETIKGVQFESAVKFNRKFVLDMSPKLLYGNGNMVNSLVKSKVCRYLEFRNVTGFFIEDGKDLIAVPCSKSALFTTTSLSPIEKRKMMKFIQENDSEEGKGNQNLDRNQNFNEYLKSLDLTDRLEKYIGSCLAFSSTTDTLASVQKRIDLFLTSYGRYGQSAFLFPLYGNCELHQAFCRLAAVFGATFCLNYEHMDTVNELKADHYIVDELQETEGDKVYNVATVITTESMFNSRVSEADVKAEGVDLMILDDGVRVFQVSGTGGQIAPAGYFVYYFFSENLDSLKTKISDHLNEESHVSTTFLKDSTCTYFDYEEVIAAAELKFREIVGADAVFLEPAPEPEDIILDGKPE